MSICSACGMEVPIEMSDEDLIDEGWELYPMIFCPWHAV
jgi:hypothetical protein